MQLQIYLNKKSWILLLFLMAIVLTGCATVGAAAGGFTSLLGLLISGTFNVIGKALEIAGSLPKPPPGVF